VASEKAGGMKLAHGLKNLVSAWRRSHAKISKEEIIKERRTQLSLPLGKLIGHGLREVPKWNYTASVVAMACKFTTEHEEFARALESDDVIGPLLGKQYGNGLAGQMLSSSGIVEAIAIQYLKRNKSFSRNSRLTNECVVKLRSHYSASEMVTDVIAYLENVRFESRTIKITPNISIESLDPQKKVALFNRTKHFSRYYTGEWLDHLDQVNALVRVRLKGSTQPAAAPLSGNRIDDAEADIRDVITTLRIGTTTQVDRSPVVVITQLYPWRKTEELFGSSQFLQYGASCTFYSKCNRGFRLLMKGLHDVDSSATALNLAIRRLSYSSLHRSDEDVIIDACIGLEIIAKRILQPREDKGRLTQKKIGKLLAPFLYDIEEGQGYVRKAVAAGFKARNIILHGKEGAPPSTDIVGNLARVFRETVAELIIYQKYR
jgi:hypothetical protein